MNTSTNAALNARIADGLNTELTRARCCDALEPCETCRAKAEKARQLRHQARVARLAELAGVDARLSGSAARLARKV